ncbi:hypothetical protein AN640_07965 [Candidatus Epulonipiscium fishelsonii]|uniref:Uncharacterized protein n=1 Tax=Candidatus Epulonipiscium fishelsonii TaxID=77094 RepID=A0ACC8XEA7_9FIRM|nr:hypothetical protein AN640_07965 [Epulopiscium sp. SCG-D08WGA-EpuloA1]OON98195.1 MAG: hypothetical protein ATN32_04770 [Epulopiscium sp. AS2M-Bin002]
MTKLSRGFDFTRNIIFKLLCMYNEDGHNNELIVKDLVTAFFKLSGIEISLDDKIIKISEYPFNKVKTIFSENFTVKKEYTHTIYPDMRIDIEPKTTMEMQQDKLEKESKQSLIIRIARSFATILENTSYDSENYIDTAACNTLWLVKQASICNYPRPVIVRNYTFTSSLEYGKMKRIEELGSEVVICLKSKKLEIYETYNDRTEKWLNLFLKNELDETDPVFQEVLKFYNNCKEKLEIKDMLVQENKYSRMLSSEIRDNELRWLKKGLEKARLKGIEAVIEQDIESDIEPNIEPDIEQDKLESIKQIAINLLKILDNNEIVNATGLTLDEVIALRNKYN